MVVMVAVEMVVEKLVAVEMVMVVIVVAKMVVVVMVVVVETVVVVVDGVDKCGYKLGYPPAHQVSPHCYVCMWHLTKLGQLQEDTFLAIVIGPQGDQAEPIRDLPWGFSILTWEVEILLLLGHYAARM